ncbi:MAG: phosphotransferase [Thermomicrobiales bacterium]|nr:phosphotransferase [Thermomicrobiales bacterium]MCO5221021.1 phosphotransferase [Thermomicrobiales bacterium]
MPLATTALDRHGLRLADDAVLGPGGSYPVVVSGDLVVKFFGFAGEWHATWRNEHVAHERLALDPRILAPQLLGAGQLFPGAEHPLPYLILTRISGVSWCDVSLTFDQRAQIAAELGEQLALVHALPHEGMPGIDAWRSGTVGDGARSRAFPPELVGAIDPWLETVPVAPPVFVHSDLFVRHPFVDDGHLTGIIDWGDAMAADPHVELGKIHLDVFEGDTRLLRIFLESYGWSVERDFGRRALAMALRRHAQILGQHGGGDVFYRVPELIAGQEVATLDDLAWILFG